MINPIDKEEGKETVAEAMVRAAQAYYKNFPERAEAIRTSEKPHIAIAKDNGLRNVLALVSGGSKFSQVQAMDTVADKLTGRPHQASAPHRFFGFLERNLA